MQSVRVPSHCLQGVRPRGTEAEHPGILDEVAIILFDPVFEHLWVEAAVGDTSHEWVFQLRGDLVLSFFAQFVQKGH